MKVNLKGLLLMAKRHLAALDEIVENTNSYLDRQDLKDKIGVEKAQLILDEFISHVLEVQADNSKLNEFAELYCLIESAHSNIARVDAIWEQAVKDVQARYDELIKEKSNDTTSTN